MYLQEFEKGMVFDLGSVKIDKQKFLAFADEYDPNRIHMDEEYGKTTRFGQIIAPGVMCFMMVWTQFIRKNIFGDQFVAAQSTSIEWHAPMFADDVITSTATVVDIEERNKYNGLITIRYDTYNQHGQHVMTNHTKSVIARRV